MRFAIWVVPFTVLMLLLDPLAAPAQGPGGKKDKSEPAKKKKAADSSDEKSDDKKPASEDKPLSASEQYSELRAQWKEVDEELKSAIGKLRFAQGGDLEKAKQEYIELVAKANQTLADLRDAALAVYKEKPGEDRQVTRVLIGLAANDVRRDQFDSAMETAQVLLDNGCDDKLLYNLAGKAAYCMDQFETAEDLLKKAEEAKSLDEEGSAYLEDVPDAKQRWTREAKLRQAEAKAEGDAKLPRVKIETTKGDVVVELFENEAPDTVGNFVSLVEDGFYDGRTFHRVLPGFMAQTGCPVGDGSGGPGYRIPCECYKEGARKHFRGTLSMAHSGRDTGGSQLFLTFRRTGHLDGVTEEELKAELAELPKTGRRKGHHTVFGRIVEGMDVLAKIKRRSPGHQSLPTPDKIVKATVLNKRDHEYKPEKVEPAEEKPTKVDPAKDKSTKEKPDEK